VFPIWLNTRRTSSSSRNAARALRLRELANELDILLSAFPALHDAFDADELPVSFIMRRDARRVRAKAVTRLRPMSAAKRRAGSRGMKKYWAERRTG